MAEEIKRVEYYSVTVATKLGEGARILAALSDGGVDFTAVWGYPLKAKTAQVDLLPADAGVFKKAAKKAGLTLTKRAALLIQGDDKPGAVSAALGKLAAAGLKLHAAQAMSSGSGRYSLLIQLEEEAGLRAGLKALTAAPKAAAPAAEPAPAKKAPAKKKK
mgnify:CR=1 FL=1